MMNCAKVDMNLLAAWGKTGKIPLLIGKKGN
jgi:hypothetical protein